MSEKKKPSRHWLSFGRICAAYVLTLALVLIALEWWAEYFLPLWFLLFAPPAVLLIPAIVLLIVGIRKTQWRWVGVLVACILCVALGFSRFRLAPDGGQKTDAFTIITHNIGQGNSRAFSEAFPGESPDVVVLQDSFRKDQLALEKRFPAYQRKSVGQFLVLSRHDIQEAVPVSTALWNKRPVAARFSIKTPRGVVAVYNVHLPTPRRSLTHAFNWRVVREMMWLGSAPTDDYPSYRAWLRARVELARQLAAAFAREPLPYFVAGDFNTPDHGVVYRMFSSKMVDAHAHAGRGWGFTFPGARDGKLAAWVGPWLRLDYVFSGPSWKATECRVASDASSQHRAVLAKFLPAL